MSSHPGPSVPFRLLATVGLALFLGCSDPEGSGSDADAAAARGGDGGTAESTTSRSQQPRIADEQLGELEREDLTLSLPWTRGRINRQAPDTASRASLRSVAFSRTDNVDRMTLHFDGAGGYPGYVVDSSVNPLPRCASADSVQVEGQGLLRVRIRNATADESSAGPSVQRPELDNVTAVHRTCLEETTAEWVLDVRRATYYRVVQASNPPRLVVDVMQAVEQDTADTDR